jgi:hypothetical protein
MRASLCENPASIACCGKSSCHKLPGSVACVPHFTARVIGADSGSNVRGTVVWRTIPCVACKSCLPWSESRSHLLFRRAAAGTPFGVLRTIVRPQPRRATNPPCVRPLAMTRFGRSRCRRDRRKVLLAEKPRRRVAREERSAETAHRSIGGAVFRLRLIIGGFCLVAA